MSQDDLSSRENQKPPSRRSWIVGLNVAAGVVAVLVFAGVALGGRHGSSPQSGQSSTAAATPTPTSAGTPTGPSSGPPVLVQFTAVGAGQHSCDSAGHAHSVTGGSKVRFKFVNETQQNLQIIWLNLAGARVNESLLPPDYMYTVNTFIGDDWMVADNSSDCLAIFSVKGAGSVTAFA